MWSRESDVDDYVKDTLKKLGLVKGEHFRQQDASAYLKESLKGFSKTKNAKGGGIPDFTCETLKYDNRVVPVLFECKFSANSKGTFVDRMASFDKDNNVRFDQNAISGYALNGALHYARGILEREQEKEKREYENCIAVAIAGKSPEDIAIKVYLVFGTSSNAFIETKTQNLDFLKSQESFKDFLDNARLTEIQKNEILKKQKLILGRYNRDLNKLMHSHNITAPQRVLYVAGLILSMQSYYDEKYKRICSGLKPNDLDGKNDGERIYKQIEKYLEMKVSDKKKRDLMLASFNEIKKDPYRDEIPKNFTSKQGQKKNPNNQIVAHLLSESASINKQIFAYIYEYIYKEIDGFNAHRGHLDVMGELYSEFLKYALGDGKELGIVLTPPYITKMMAEILEITDTDKVMDLATGSAGFLVSAMSLMCEKVKEKEQRGDLKKDYGDKSSEELINELKKNQLLGVELNAEMFALAVTNMILRGDGSSQIYKGNSFDASIAQIIREFGADKLLLNPPFTFEENGMPFIKIGLDNMSKNGLGAIIIQDSAGSGKAINTNKEILKHHTLIASIKMPPDLFQPMAGVQTSIYVFRAKIPHDFEKSVKFIDFRNDGFKRVKRNLQEVDNPSQRYEDIIRIYKGGLNAKVDSTLWNLKELYVEDTITQNGNDWNFDQHKTIDTKPTLEDFKKCVSDYLAWEVSNILKQENKASLGKSQSPRLKELDEKFKQNGGTWKEFKLEDKFERVAFKKLAYKKSDLPENATQEYDLPALTCARENQGLSCYVPRNEATILKNVISVAANGDAPAFYQSQEFTILQDAYAIRFKDKELNSSQYLFLTTLLQKVLTQFNWSNKSGWERVKKEKILLPIDKQENIAFDYMESYIAELEAERVEELEAYLKATGFENFILNQNEMFALQSFEKLSNPPKNQKALNKDSDFIGGGGIKLSA